MKRRRLINAIGAGALIPLSGCSILPNGGGDSSGGFEPTETDRQERCTRATVSNLRWEGKEGSNWCPTTLNESWVYYVTIEDKGTVDGEVTVEIQLWESESEEVPKETTVHSISIEAKERKTHVIKIPPGDECLWASARISEQDCL